LTQKRPLTLFVKAIQKLSLTLLSGADLRRQNDLDGAIASLNRVTVIDPRFPQRGTL